MPEWSPLSARSVVLSLLLGAHPRALTSRALVRSGDHLGIAAATIRVALTRAVAAGDLQREDDGYHLGGRLLERQRRQDAHAAVRAWHGDWETVVVVGAGRPSGDRAALRTTLTAARLAELREGVWLRPANLARPAPGPDAAVRTFLARPDGDPAALAAALWDLDGWAGETDRTLQQLGRTSAPAARLAVAAHLVRHLATDPLLPRELEPPGWPADRARTAYADYQREVLALGLG